MHRWKNDGCPAFEDDGAVDLGALSRWLADNRLGERSRTATEAFRPPAPTFFRGGRDYANDLSGLHEEAMRVFHLLEDDGHAEAAEKWRDAFYDRIRPVIDEFIAHLEKTGLAEPLGE